MQADRPAAPSPTEQLSFWCFALIFALVVFGLIFSVFLHAENWGGPICGFLREICHAGPYLVGALVMGVLWAVCGLLGNDWNPFECIRGADNRWSVSKLQLFLWTLVGLFAYASLYAARIGVGGLGPEEFYIPYNLFLAMGFSVTTAVAAKSITVSQLSGNLISKAQVAKGDAAPGDLVQDDSGMIDLTKVQVLGWSIVAMGAFLANLVHAIQHVHADTQLPDIDSALMVLMGLGHGTYLGKKLIVNTAPAISSIAPDNGRGGTLFTILGSNFGISATNNQIAIDGVPITSPAIKSWSDGSIQFQFPEPPPGTAYTFTTKKNVGLIIGGRESNTAPVTLAQPVAAALALDTKGNKYTLSGAGFGTGSAQVSLSVNGTAVSGVLWNETNWTDTSVSFPSSSIPPIDSTKPLAVTLNVDGNAVGPMPVKFSQS